MLFPVELLRLEETLDVDVFGLSCCCIISAALWPGVKDEWAEVGGSMTRAAASGC